MSRRRGRDGDEDGRGRRRRYQKQTNWTGITIFALVFVVLLIVVFTLIQRMNREAEAPPPTGGEPSREQPTVEPRPDRPESADPQGTSPDRPAPDLKGEQIQVADRTFRAAKSSWARAQTADESGESAAYDEHLAECRQQLAKIEQVLAPHTQWLKDAKAKGWEIPHTYGTLEKRTARYDEFRKGLPGKRP